MSTLKADTIVASDGSSPVTLTKQHAAKMWLQFTMGTPTIQSSFNVSSMTDTATGDAAANITNAFSSATGYSLTSGGNHYFLGNDVADNDTASIVSYRQFTNSSSGVLADGTGQNASLTAHGDLA